MIRSSTCIHVHQLPLRWMHIAAQMMYFDLDLIHNLAANTDIWVLAVGLQPLFLHLFSSEIVMIIELLKNDLD